MSKMRFAHRSLRRFFSVVDRLIGKHTHLPIQIQLSRRMQLRHETDQSTRTPAENQSGASTRSSETGIHLLLREFVCVRNQQEERTSDIYEDFR